MKCKKLFLVVLGFSLVVSPAFSGWALLDTSKKSSMELSNQYSQEYQEEKKDSYQKDTEVLVSETSTRQAPTPTNQVILEAEKTKYLNFQEQNERGIKNLSKKLNELENSSILTQSKKLTEFGQALQNLKLNLQNSNEMSLSAEQLLNSYDNELTNLEKEINRVHLGLGASYFYAPYQEMQGASIDAYLRKNNVYLNGSVAYPIDANTFKSDFDTEKLSYKVGLGIEF